MVSEPNNRSVDTQRILDASSLPTELDKMIALLQANRTRIGAVLIAFQALPGGELVGGPPEAIARVTCLHPSGLDMATRQRVYELITKGE